MKDLKIIFCFFCCLLINDMYAQFPKSGNEAINAKASSEDIAATKFDRSTKFSQSINPKDIVSIDESGDLNASIPLFEVKSRTMSFPVSLFYKSGIKANQKSTEVGLGWNINFGSITRDYGAFEPDYASTNSEANMTPADPDCNGDNDIDLWDTGQLIFCNEAGYGLNPNLNTKYLKSNKIEGAISGQLTPDNYNVTIPGLGANSFWNAGQSGQPHDFAWAKRNAWKIAFQTKVFEVPQEVSRINEWNLNSAVVNSIPPTNVIISGIHSFATAICIPPYVNDRYYNRLATDYFALTGMSGVYLNETTNKVKYRDFSEFVITTDDGIKYVFGKALRGQKYLFDEDPFWSTLPYDACLITDTPENPSCANNQRCHGELWKIDYIAEWLLTEIRSADYFDENQNGILDDEDSGDWIRIEYNDMVGDVISSSDFSSMFGAVNQHPKYREWLNLTQTDKASSLMRERAYVSKIITPLMELDVETSTKFDVDHDYFKIPFNRVFAISQGDEPAYIYAEARENNSSSSNKSDFHINYPCELQKYESVTVKSRVNGEVMQKIDFIYAEQGSEEELAKSSYLIIGNNGIEKEVGYTNSAEDYKKFFSYTEGLGNNWIEDYKNLSEKRGRTTLKEIKFIPSDLNTGKSYSYKFNYGYNPDISEIHKREIIKMRYSPTIRQCFTNTNTFIELLQNHEAYNILPFRSVIYKNEYANTAEAREYVKCNSVYGNTPIPVGIDVFNSTENSPIDMLGYFNAPDDNLSTANGKDAWSLTQIELPEKGTINITYESDQFEYEEDKQNWSLEDQTITPISQYNSLAKALSINQDAINRVYEASALAPEVYVEKTLNASFETSMENLEGGIRVIEIIYNDNIVNTNNIRNRYQYGKGHYKSVPNSYWSNYLSALGIFVKMENWRHDIESGHYSNVLTNVGGAMEYLNGTDFNINLSQWFNFIGLDRSVSDQHFYETITELFDDGGYTTKEYDAIQPEFKYNQQGIVAVKDNLYAGNLINPMNIKLALVEDSNPGGEIVLTSLKHYKAGETNPVYVERYTHNVDEEIDYGILYSDEIKHWDGTSITVLLGITSTPNLAHIFIPGFGLEYLYSFIFEAILCLTGVPNDIDCNGNPKEQLNCDDGSPFYMENNFRLWTYSLEENNFDNWEARLLPLYPMGSPSNDYYPFYNTPYPFKINARISYLNSSSWQTLIAKQVQLDDITTNYQYTYDPYHYQLTSEVQTVADGTIIATNYRYAGDYGCPLQYVINGDCQEGASTTNDNARCILEMKHVYNMLSTPIEVQTLKNNKLVAGQINVFRKTNNSVRVAEIFALETVEPMVDFINGSSFVGFGIPAGGNPEFEILNPNYKQQYVYTYNPAGNLVQSYRTNSGSTELYTWNDDYAQLTEKEEVHTDAPTFITTYSYDPTFQKLATVTDANEKQRQYEYDEFGRVNNIYFHPGGSEPVQQLYSVEYHNIGQTGATYIPDIGSPEMNYVSVIEKNLAYIYYTDGLGRPLQNIAIAQAPDTKDIITHIEYDAVGRKEKEYAPVSLDGTAGSFRTNFTSNNFYAIGNGNQVEPTDNPYTQYVYEPSPLNRLIETAAPGDPWSLGTGKTKRSKYGTIWGNFYMTKNYDENNNVSWEFKDLLNRPAIQLTPIGSSIYYLYDDFNNITEVVTPSGTYQYSYDERQRVIAKGIPGKEVTYYVYDPLDRVILQQDGNLRTQEKWTYTQYDGAGRILETGLYTTDKTREELQTEVNALIYEHFALFTNHLDGNKQMLTQNEYDAEFIGSLDNTLEKILDPDNLEPTDEIVASTTYDSRYRMLATDANNHLNGTDRFEYTYNNNTDLPAFIYHRHTTTPVAENDFTYIVGKTLNYGPANRINELSMAVNNPTIQTIVAQYDYNPIGQHTEKNLHKPNGATGFLQSVDYRYNNRGWMTSINDQTNLSNETGTIALAPDLYAQILLYTSTGAFGGTTQFNGNISGTYWRNATDFVERGYAFSYDEMNRLKKAYSSSPSTDGNWDEQCTYDPAGNILGLQRRGKTGTSSYGLIDRMHYNYIFDGTGVKKLNAIDDQITASLPTNDFEDNGSIFSTSHTDEYVYDANGNIVIDFNKGITTRYNHLNLPDKVTFHSTGNTITWLYTATGRKLQKRTCESGTAQMPPPPATPPIDKHRFFSARMDSVGSARLPGTDTLTEGEYYRNISGRIQFIKRLLAPTFTNPAESMPPSEPLPTNCDKRDYIGSVEYYDNTPEAYHHEEGRINLLPGMNLRHEYSLRDHLGNTRICFTDSDNDGDPEILQQTTYYPFGLPIEELSETFDGVGNNYQYNGIELIEDFGLHVNHAQFRTLDPQTGRWWQTDPMAELAPEWSPYRFSFNNPILNTDPLGLFETRKEAKAYRKEHEMSGKINKSWEDGKKVFSIESQTRIMQTGEDGSRETLNINASTYRWSESGEVVTATEITPNSNTWQPFTGSSGAIEQDYTLEGLAMPLGKLFGGSRLFKTGGNFADEAAKGSTSLFKSFTKSNFRHNLGQLTGNIPANSHAHHVFPQKFANQFSKAGINIHDPKFGVWWQTSSHLKNASGYNEVWKQFFKNNPTQSQILDKGRQLMQQYGIPVNF